MKTIILAPILSLAFLAAPAGANTGWKDRVGSNSLSDEPRSESAPAMVKTPPNGVPTSGMSTVDSGGAGLVKRDKFDQDEDEAATTPTRAHRRYSHGDEDTVSTRSAAPMREHAFAFYGEDIPALKGLQLETALNRLHHINQMEIDTAKLVESRAKSEDVLQLAHRIRDDHEKLEKRVQALADRRDITLQSFQLATYEKACRDRLGKLYGKEFETAFLRVNERSHEEAAMVLRGMRANLADAETRSLINEALPQMTAHELPAGSAWKAKASTEEGDIGE